ncbi:MAG: [protein-PII] uridylyltransferase [Rhodobacteraceae bacterium]|nr:[protein-PII] uridylyltransferase [Paracoccaceae bacterium]
MKDLTLGGLIGAPSDIWDSGSIKAALEDKLFSAKDKAETRMILVEVLSAAIATGRSVIASALEQEPYQARAATRAYAWLSDQVVKQALSTTVKHLHPLANPTSSERLGVIAVGGYGRMEMAPFSDIDLLFLTPYKQTAWGESVIESMLYTLWDLRLKVGHATRTVDDCIRLGREDYTIRTALLENRFICGDTTLAEELDTRLWKELFANTASDFTEAKLAERGARHARHGGARYVVEPNVKEGKGGLRDLQTLFWIAKYINHADGPKDLVEAGMLTKDECAVFIEAETFLWTVRTHLHLLGKRASEKLGFNMQVDLARVLGFSDSAGMRGVERFMQQYFLHAKNVGELTRIFLTDLEARHVKAKPGIGQWLRSAFSWGRDGTPRGYTLHHGRLDVVDREAFLSDPINFMRLYEEGLRSGILIHPDAMRLIARNLHLIDDDFRNNPEANRIFLDLLLSHNNPERALRRMNELGVLGAFIPDFGRIVAMMQFNMYHSYTVDEHTIQVISSLFRIEQQGLVEDLPIASQILKAGINRKVLYVALLLHDIGKGRQEAHEVIGACIARDLCPRLGLSDEDSELVEWLVRHHLLMSDVAQKRDISDLRTVQDFAKTVKSVSRLKLLLVLTVCDIRGVGPDVWNNWKAMLLRQLYAATHDQLTGGAQAQSQPQREDEAQSELAKALKGWSKSEIAVELERHYTPYWLGLDTATHKAFARLIKKLSDEPFISDIKVDHDRAATRACFVMHDHPGLFARLAGALALVGANVVDARTYTSSDGLATAVFWIQDSEGAPYEKSRLTRLSKMIARILGGEVIARDALKTRDIIKPRERDFKVPTTITFDNEGSEIYTIIEVDTRDRPGLIHDIARTLSANSISIATAIIATYGEQAVDTFYVKDLFGHKIHAKEKRAALEAKLYNAITKKPEQEDMA